MGWKAAIRSSRLNDASSYGFGAFDSYHQGHETCLLDPSGHGLPRGLGDLELHRCMTIPKNADYRDSTAPPKNQNYMQKASESPTKSPSGRTQWCCSVHPFFPGRIDDGDHGHGKSQSKPGKLGDGASCPQRRHGDTQRPARAPANHNFSAGTLWRMKIARARGDKSLQPVVRAVGTSTTQSCCFECAHEFQQSPELFCTSASHNSFFMSAGFFSNHHKTWNISGKKFPTLLCMTDALGEWALGNAQDGKPAWERLCSIDSVPQLEALVFTERENKKMRIDDVTIIRIEFDRVENHGLPHA